MPYGPLPPCPSGLVLMTAVVFRSYLPFPPFPPFPPGPLLTAAGVFH